MEIRNHKTVQLDIQSTMLRFSGPASMRDGVITFLYARRAHRLTTTATIDGEPRRIRIEPIKTDDGRTWHKETLPFLQATILDA